MENLCFLQISFVAYLSMFHLLLYFLFVFRMWEQAGKRRGEEPYKAMFLFAFDNVIVCFAYFFGLLSSEC